MSKVGVIMTWQLQYCTEGRKQRVSTSSSEISLHTLCCLATEYVFVAWDQRVAMATVRTHETGEQNVNLGHKCKFVCRKLIAYSFGCSLAITRECIFKNKTWSPYPCLICFILWVLSFNGIMIIVSSLHCSYSMRSNRSNWSYPYLLVQYFG